MSPTYVYVLGNLLNILKKDLKTTITYVKRKRTAELLIFLPCRDHIKPNFTGTLTSIKKKYIKNKIAFIIILKVFIIFKGMIDGVSLYLLMMLHIETRSWV